MDIQNKPGSPTASQSYQSACNLDSLKFDLGVGASVVGGAAIGALQHAVECTVEKLSGEVK